MTPERRTIQETLDRSHELAERFENYEPRSDDEVDVTKYLQGRARRTDPFALADAIAMAALAHRDQTYPSPDPEPYIFHPLRVMQRVTTDDERIVAVLHDILEDTATTVDDLRVLGCPARVIAALETITHRDGEPYDAYIERVAQNDLARAAKVADLRDNLDNNLRDPAAPGNADRIHRYEAALLRLGAS